MNLGVEFSVLNYAAWPPAVDNPAAWSAGADGKLAIGGSSEPALSDLPPMLRRCAGGLAKMALEAAQRCFGNRRDLPIVFCSRHGEADRAVSLLTDLVNSEPLSPTSFALSVHNAASGLFPLRRRPTPNAMKPSAAQIIRHQPATIAPDFIGWSFRSLGGFLRFTRVLDYKISGAEKFARPGLLILANHPTCLDIVFFLKLQRGAAHVAVRSDCNITPVPIRRRPLMLARGVRWWKLPQNRSQFDIEVKDEIDNQPFVTRVASEVLAVRRPTDHLRDFFAKEQRIHASV
jgi:hypothetical protein